MHKVFDDDAMFFDAEDTSSWTASTHNSASIDLGGDDMDEVHAGRVAIRWPGLSSAGSPSITIVVADSADDSTFTDMWTSEAYTETTAVAAMTDDYLVFDLPANQLRRYVRLEIVVGTAALDGGTLTAGLVK